LGAEVRHAERRVLFPPDTRARTRGDILISGTTGFLGMELTARLLEDGDRRVWALVRASSQEQAAARVRSMPARLVAEPDRFADRVVPVAGDLLQPGLGLDPRRRDELAEHVDEVIHAAASVSFGLPLPEARAVNVEGTRRMLELATDVSARGRGLRRFAHVSTAYVAGTHRGVFGETDLECGQGFHNSYERSKWEAERLVRRHAERLPVQVMRPSVVVGDELSGWTASFNVIYQPLRAYARGAPFRRRCTGASCIPCCFSAPARRSGRGSSAAASSSPTSRHGSASTPPARMPRSTRWGSASRPWPTTSTGCSTSPTGPNGAGAPSGAPRPWPRGRPRGRRSR
jgi:nucleoside-diphosphate-sugar epimerase